MDMTTSLGLGFPLNPKPNGYGTKVMDPQKATRNAMHNNTRGRVENLYSVHELNELMHDL